MTMGCMISDGEIVAVDWLDVEGTFGLMVLEIDMGFYMGLDKVGELRGLACAIYLLNYLF